MEEGGYNGSGRGRGKERERERESVGDERTKGEVGDGITEDVNGNGNISVVAWLLLYSYSTRPDDALNLHGQRAAISQKRKKNL